MISDFLICIRKAFMVGQGGRHGIWDGRAVDMDGPLVPGRKSELNFDERNGGWMGCKYGDLL